MTKEKISLPSVNAVKDFVNITAKYPFDVDLVSDRYRVDGRSIMGVFSLDISKPIGLEIHSDDDAVEKYLNEISEYLIVG